MWEMQQWQVVEMEEKLSETCEDDVDKVENSDGQTPEENSSEVQAGKQWSEPCCVDGWANQYGD